MNQSDSLKTTRVEELQDVLFGFLFNLFRHIDQKYEILATSPGNPVLKSEPVGNSPE